MIPTTAKILLSDCDCYGWHMYNYWLLDSLSSELCFRKSQVGYEFSSLVTWHNQGSPVFLCRHDVLAPRHLRPPCLPPPQRHEGRRGGAHFWASGQRQGVLPWTHRGGYGVHFRVSGQSQRLSSMLNKVNLVPGGDGRSLWCGCCINRPHEESFV